MKQTRRIPALLLAMVMLVSLCLTGCQKKEEIIPADQSAIALFNLTLKDDATSAMELFGYSSEEEMRKDMGIENGIYNELAEEMVSQLERMGVTTSNEDIQTFIDAFLTMFKNVEMTAKVKDSDEKEGTAVVTCTISTFDPNALQQAMTEALTEAMADPSVVAGEDTAATFSLILKAMSKAISGLTPTGDTKDFDVDFKLSTMEVNGKDRKMWLPEDKAEFDNLISTTAMGG